MKEFNVHCCAFVRYNILSLSIRNLIYKLYLNEYAKFLINVIGIPVTEENSSKDRLDFRAYTRESIWSIHNDYLEQSAACLFKITMKFYRVRFGSPALIKQKFQNRVNYGVSPWKFLYSPGSTSKSAISNKTSERHVIFVSDGEALGRSHKKCQFFPEDEDDRHWNGSRNIVPCLVLFPPKKNRRKENNGEKIRENNPALLDFRFFVSTNGGHNSVLATPPDGAGLANISERVRVAGASVARTRVPICDSYVEISDT